MKPAWRGLWAGERKPSSGSLSSLLRHHLKRRSQLVHSLPPTPFCLKFQRVVLWKLRRENLLISHDKKPSGKTQEGLQGDSNGPPRLWTVVVSGEHGVGRPWSSSPGVPLRLHLLTLADYPCCCPKQRAGPGWEVREAAVGQSVPGPRPSCCSSGSPGSAEPSVGRHPPSGPGPASSLLRVLFCSRATAVSFLF